MSAASTAATGLVVGVPRATMAGETVTKTGAYNTPEPVLGAQHG